MLFPSTLIDSISSEVRSFTFIFTETFLVLSFPGVLICEDVQLRIKKLNNKTEFFIVEFINFIPPKFLFHDFIEKLIYKIFFHFNIFDYKKRRFIRAYQ